MSKPFVVGICGGSGAGKTTLLKRLSETFQGASTAVFSMDNYYLPIEQQTKDANGIVNFDLPTALDHQKLTTDLQTLISGQPIDPDTAKYLGAWAGILGNRQSVMLFHPDEPGEDRLYAATMPITIYARASRGARQVRNQAPYHYPGQGKISRADLRSEADHAICCWQNAGGARWLRY